jgi:hypothetical protein
VPAGDFDYEEGGGVGYARRRRTDPRIAASVLAALGEAATALNVDAVAEARRYPALGGEVVPIPLDCEDGFIEAFYGRPEALLDPEVRRSQSAWAFGETAAGLERLRSDLESGDWDARHGHLRTQPFFDGSLRLVVL